MGYAYIKLADVGEQFELGGVTTEMELDAAGLDGLPAVLDGGLWLRWFIEQQKQMIPNVIAIMKDIVDKWTELRRGTVGEYVKNMS